MTCGVTGVSYELQNRGFHTRRIHPDWRYFVRARALDSGIRIPETLKEDSQRRDELSKIDLAPHESAWAHQRMGAVHQFARRSGAILDLIQILPRRGIEIVFLQEHTDIAME